ncbi:MAG: zinc ribbon domain-containing protein [Bacteroidales bacterium]|nr:zinc ribbon domain-containing protein [Bacteroidales bacterium]
MRCNYCGMQNDDSAAVCSNCGRPLQQAQRQGAVSPQPSVIPHRPTILEPDGGYTQQQPNQSYGQVPQSNCSKCNYPLQPGVSICPNCNTPVKGSAQPTIQPQPQANSGNHRPTVIGTLTNDQPQQPFQPQPQNQSDGVSFNTNGPQPNNIQRPKNNSPFKGTVNIYDNPMGMFQTEFTLTPIKRNNERHEFSPIVFDGDEVELNRNNLEHNNMSITSQTQAVITCEDGRFYITDKSEFKTTFVQAKDKIEIKDGDVVLMGNRMFEFHA